ncbi:protein CutA isoform 2-T3 [Morphnus guianensis]
MYPVLRSLALQLHSAVTGSYVSGTHSIAFINCLNEQIAKDIARAIMDKKLAAYVNILPKSSALYFWKGELEESTEILLVSDNSPCHENPHPRQPQPKGVAGWFGEGDTNLPKIWDSTQGPRAPPCRHGSGIWGRQPGSAPHPATTGNIPQGRAQEGLPSHHRPPAMLDGCSRTAHAGLLCTLYFSLGFCFGLFFTLHS